MCPYPTLNFRTRYPKHTYFFIWPNMYKDLTTDSMSVKISSLVNKSKIQIIQSVLEVRFFKSSPTRSSQVKSSNYI